MRRFHVKVYYRHVKGSSEVSPEESRVTFVSAYEVNGVYVSEDWAQLSFSPFGELWLSLPDPAHPRHEVLVDPYVELYESLTPDDCLEGSDFNFSPGVVRSAIRGIPVSSIEMINGNWFEARQVA